MTVTAPIKTFESVIEERHAITVDAIDVGYGKFVFRYLEEITRTGAKPKRVSKQGVCTASQLKSLRAGKNIETEPFFGVSDTVADNIRRFGYLGIAYDEFKQVKGMDKVFDFVANGGSLENLIRLNSFDHSFWKLDGSVFPYGLRFDYTEAQIDDFAYDLERLVEILRARQDITILAATENIESYRTGARRRYNQLPMIAEPGQEIDDIPSYNREDGADHTVTFYWTPTSEQHAFIREAGARWKGHSLVSRGRSKYEVIFDEDWLGLRAGGAARFKDFYSTQRV